VRHVSTRRSRCVPRSGSNDASSICKFGYPIRREKPGGAPDARGARFCRGGGNHPGVCRAVRGEGSAAASQGWDRVCVCDADDGAVGGDGCWCVGQISVRQRPRGAADGVSRDHRTENGPPRSAWIGSAGSQLDARTPWSLPDAPHVRISGTGQPQRHVAWVSNLAVFHLRATRTVRNHWRLADDPIGGRSGPSRHASTCAAPLAHVPGAAHRRVLILSGPGKGHSEANSYHSAPHDSAAGRARSLVVLAVACADQAVASGDSVATDGWRRRERRSDLAGCPRSPAGCWSRHFSRP
jgi:hypothetical protein